MKKLLNELKQFLEDGVAGGAMGTSAALGAAPSPAIGQVTVNNKPWTSGKSHPAKRRKTKKDKSLNEARQKVIYPILDRHGNPEKITASELETLKSIIVELKNEVMEADKKFYGSDEEIKKYNGKNYEMNVMGQVCNRLRKTDSHLYDVLINLALSAGWRKTKSFYGPNDRLIWDMACSIMLDIVNGTFAQPLNTDEAYEWHDPVARVTFNNESIKESLKNEYKQAFDLLVEGENIVGTLDTDFGRQFVKDVESLYEIKSSKLKLRKAKELLKDIQGYLVDEQYDGYNAKINKFMNNSKNESVKEDKQLSLESYNESQYNPEEFEKLKATFNNVLIPIWNNTWHNKFISLLQNYGYQIITNNKIDEFLKKGVFIQTDVKQDIIPNMVKLYTDNGVIFNTILDNRPTFMPNSVSVLFGIYTKYRDATFNILGDTHYEKELGSFGPILNGKGYKSANDARQVDIDVTSLKYMDEEQIKTKFENGLQFMYKYLEACLQQIKDKTIKNESIKEDYEWRGPIAKITFDNGDTIETAINGTDEEIRNYYMNNTFNLGLEDDLHKVVDVEIIRQANETFDDEFVAAVHIDHDFSAGADIRKYDVGNDEPLYKVQFTAKDEKGRLIPIYIADGIMYKDGDWNRYPVATDWILDMKDVEKRNEILDKWYSFHTEDLAFDKLVDKIKQQLLKLDDANNKANKVDENLLERLERLTAPMNENAYIKWEQHKQGLAMAGKYIKLTVPVFIPDQLDLDLVAYIFQNKSKQGTYGFGLIAYSGSDSTLIENGYSNSLNDVVQLCIDAIKHFDELNNTNIIYDVKPLEPNAEDIEFLADGDINEKLTEGYVGLSDVKYISHGNWSDAELEYKGFLYSEPDVSEWAYADYEESESDLEFDDWIRENPDSIYSALHSLTPNEGYAIFDEDGNIVAIYGNEERAVKEALKLGADIQEDGFLTGYSVAKTDNGRWIGINVYNDLEGDDFGEINYNRDWAKAKFNEEYDKNCEEEYYQHLKSDPNLYDLEMLQDSKSSLIAKAGALTDKDIAELNAIVRRLKELQGKNESKINKNKRGNKMNEGVTKSNYNEIIKTLSDTLARAAKENPDAHLVKNYQATTGSNGVYFDEGLHFRGEGAVTKAIAVSEKLQEAMKKYGFKVFKYDSMSYRLGNDKASSIISFGMEAQGSNGATAGYHIVRDNLKFLESKINEGAGAAVTIYFDHDPSGDYNIKADITTISNENKITLKNILIADYYHGAHAYDGGYILFEEDAMKEAFVYDYNEYSRNIDDPEITVNDIESVYLGGYDKLPPIVFGGGWIRSKCEFGTVLDWSDEYYMPQIEINAIINGKEERIITECNGKYYPSDEACVIISDPEDAERAEYGYEDEEYDESLTAEKALAKSKTILEEYGVYKGEPDFEEIARQLEYGNTYGTCYSGAEWGEVEVDGTPISDLLKTNEVLNWVLNEISYPVRDGHPHYYELELDFNNYSYYPTIDHTNEDVIADLVTLGFDEDLIREMGVIDDENYSGSITDPRFKEISTWVKYDINYVEPEKDEEYNESKINEGASESHNYKTKNYDYIFNLSLIKQALDTENSWLDNATTEEQAPEVMLFIVNDEKSEILDTKLVPRKDIYTYQGNDNEYYLDRTRDTGWWTTDYQLSPVEKMVDVWNYGKSSKMDESESSISTLRNELNAAIKKFFNNDPDALDWAFVDITKEEDGVRVEVRAELDYNGMWELSDALDPVVQKYDEDAYFEQDQPGIMVAYIENKKFGADSSLSRKNESRINEDRYFHVGDKVRIKGQHEKTYEISDISKDEDGDNLFNLYNPLTDDIEEEPMYDYELERVAESKIDEEEPYIVEIWQGVSPEENFTSECVNKKEFKTADEADKWAKSMAGTKYTYSVTKGDKIIADTRKTNESFDDGVNYDEVENAITKHLEKLGFTDVANDSSFSFEYVDGNYEHLISYYKQPAELLYVILNPDGDKILEKRLEVKTAKDVDKLFKTVIYPEFDGHENYSKLARRLSNLISD